MSYVEIDPHEFADAKMRMITVIEHRIRRAREIGRPDPTDDQLYLTLTQANLHAVDISAHFASAKTAALQNIVRPA